MCSVVQPFENSFTLMIFFVLLLTLLTELLFHNVLMYSLLTIILHKLC
uniref:Uncharacterized protein n=1 Tax=Arundo donax TaxID=35708 RepID=A0A0A9FWY7_ARUDO